MPESGSALSYTTLYDVDPDDWLELQYRDLFLRPGGRSCLPVSVAGFMQANSLNRSIVTVISTLSLSPELKAEFGL